MNAYLSEPPDTRGDPDVPVCRGCGTDSGVGDEGLCFHCAKASARVCAVHGPIDGDWSECPDCEAAVVAEIDLASGVFGTALDLVEAPDAA